MSDAEAAAVRASMPDDPVELPENSLACECCGVAVEDGQPVATMQPWPATAASTLRPTAVQYARCGDCQRVHDEAVQYVAEHPRLAAQLGPDLAVDRVEAVLFGLQVLGRPVPADLALLLTRLHPASHGLRWRDPLALTTGLCAPHPWAHVTIAQRAALRTSYAAALKDRLALSAPPVAIRCPTSGCLLCGLRSIDRAAIEVARRGGVEATVEAVWRETVVSPSALGMPGADNLRGHLCPSCATAVDAVGSIGPSACSRALIDHVRRVRSERAAERLRVLIRDEAAPVPPAWAALRERPFAEPWAHARRVVDRL